MTLELVNPTLTNRAEMPIARLPERYGISFPELFGRFLQLEIQPEEIEGALCVGELQLQRLDDLHASLQGTGETFLYRCNECGDLWLVDTPLHMDKNQLRPCDGSKGKTVFHIGKFELIASGPHEQLVDLAHTMMLGLDNPMKGI